MMKPGPCKGCPDRTITCHGFCKKYQAWKAEHDTEMNWLKEQNKNPTSEACKKASHKKIKRTARGLEKKRRKYDRY